MIIEKRAIDHVNDFFGGIYDTAVSAPISFGDFAARISGYRDYQFNNGSVLDLNSNLEQKQALNEMKILYEAIKNDTTRNLIIDALVQDIENRPAYYFGGLGTTSAIGNTFANLIAKNTYKLSITEAEIAETVHQLYGAYNPNNSFVVRYDPLILDLNGDGVKTISQQTSKAFFDLSGDGMSEQTGWVDSNDGLLVFDKNGNGKIDDINELFGNANQSGFSELKQLFDANNDNLIDDKDINFSQLKVWQDINGDGISQENELKSLDELGITSINLKATSTSIDSNGNTIKATSTFTQNGEIKQIS